MSILHSQLAIYGAIDELVIEARKGNRGEADQKLLTAAAQLLPNSTGFGQAGWYRQLEGFFNRELLRTSEPVVFPALDAATDELIKVPPPGPIRARGRVTEPDQGTKFSQEPTSRATAAFEDTTSDQETEPDQETASDQEAEGGNPEVSAGFEAQPLYDSAYDPALARAGYGAFVLTRLATIVQWDKLDQFRDDLVAVIGVAVRAFNLHGEVGDPFATAGVIVNAAAGVETRQGWVALLDANGINPRFGQDSRPCFGSLQQINGRYCSTVVTDSIDDDLSVADVERIVDPMNWWYCSKFFCKMQQNTPKRNKEHWSRVRETIGAECQFYGLSTDLIFYKGRQADGSIYMNYDIDPQRQDHPYVLVDNGYILVSPLPEKGPTEKGVRIRTSKQEHVQGLSPCATAALACLMGWADAGRDMLAGTAHKLIKDEAAGLPTPPLKKFVESRFPDPAEPE